MTSSPLFLLSCLQARLLVLMAIVGTIGILLARAYPVGSAAAISCLATAGAVEVACRLTAPSLALGVRVGVVLLILVFVVTLVCLGYPGMVAVGVVLGIALPATEITRRLTGHSYRFLRPSY